MRRRQWARLERLEALRPDPLAELRIRAANAPPPRLADIATQDPSPDGPRQGAGAAQGKAGAAGGQPQSSFSLAAQLQQQQAGAGAQGPPQQQQALQGPGASGGASAAPRGAQGAGAPAAPPGQQAAPDVRTAEAAARETPVSMQVVQGPLGAFVAPAPPRPAQQAPASQGA